ncbi:MAG: ABC transporter substrate-binding protein [Clostridiales bacterium]|jgi:iron complex transport system substrate-binding protein|nr:ABC transporter substrate-binding protein [Clostridiales bacterium]
MKRNKIVSLILVFTLLFVLVSCQQSNQDLANNKDIEEQELNTEGNTDEDIKQDVDSHTETSYPLTITDFYNREVTIEREPKRIISVAPAITETVYALGKGDSLIARTDFCDYPEEVASIESIGGLMDPNIERIVELEPDLVIAGAIFQKEILEKLEEAGLKVIILNEEQSFDGAYFVIEEMGKVLNAQEEAAKIVAGMKATVEEVAKKVEGRERPSVYFVMGFGEWGDYTAGRGTLIGQLIDMAGGKNAADDVEGWEYSLEKLIEKNPDHLICSISDNHREQLKEAEHYKDLDAVVNDRILEIDKNKLERPGPRLAEGLREIAEYLHPDAFK